MPVISFAQNSGFQTQVQTAPTYNYSGSTTGIQAVNVSGENASFGNTAQKVQTPVTGPVVGVSARYSSGIVSGLSCTLPNNPTFGKLISYATCILSKSIIPLILGFAMVLFIWGVVQYVINTDDETKKKKGKQFMIWGIVALAVMTSVWGLVRILGNTFGVNTTVIPQLNTGANSNNINQAPIQTDPTAQRNSFIDVIKPEEDNSFGAPSANQASIQTDPTITNNTFNSVPIQTVPTIPAGQVQPSSSFSSSQSKP